MSHGQRLSERGDSRDGIASSLYNSTSIEFKNLKIYISDIIKVN